MAKKRIIQLSLFDAFASEEKPVTEPQKNEPIIVVEEKQQQAIAESEDAIDDAPYKSTNVILPGNMANNIIDIQALRKQIAPTTKEVPEEIVTIPEPKLPVDNKNLSIVLPKIVEENNTELANTHLFDAVIEAKPTPVEIVSTYSFDEQPKQILVAEPTATPVEKQVIIEKAQKKENQIIQKPTTYKTTSTKRRGRKSQAEMAQEAKWLNIPANDILNSKQYYTIGQVATMFNANVSKIRFWEEQLSSMLKVRKNRKGDRYFTPDNIRTLEQIYMLTSQKGLTMGGAAQLIENQKNGVHTQEMILANLDELKQFLLHLQASLSI